MSIYEQHDKAFSRVSAYVVAHDGKRVATIAFKSPADGAGRLYAYVHWLGEPMVRGFAGGYGYDKRSAACADAIRRSPERSPQEKVEYFARMERLAEMGDQYAPAELARLRAHNAARSAFRDALAKDDGAYWYQRLEAAGFAVWQAV